MRIRYVNLRVDQPWIPRPRPKRDCERRRLIERDNSTSPARPEKNIERNVIVHEGFPLFVFQHNADFSERTRRFSPHLKRRGCLSRPHHEVMLIHREDVVQPGFRHAQRLHRHLVVVRDRCECFWVRVIPHRSPGKEFHSKPKEGQVGYRRRSDILHIHADDLVRPVGGLRPDASRTAVLSEVGHFTRYIHAALLPEVVRT